jgi:hypothetical protein
VTLKSVSDSEVAERKSMSNTKLGEDCCGDRYECNTVKRCKCGCGLSYCRICYADHMAAVGEKLLRKAKKAGLTL